MREEQILREVTVSQVVGEVRTMRDSGFRLVQIGATATPAGYELNYSFDKQLRFENLRITLASNAVEVPSVSSVYWNAFLYENEIHDLFGIPITGIAIDYQGDFYKTTVKFPFEKPKLNEQ